MDLVATVINGAVVVLVGGLLSWQLNGRFRQLERRMDAFQHSVDALRSDLTRVALAVGTKPEAGTGG